jgi:photosystem II stability/assembly factor-like uncharacterized protein
MQPYNEQMRRTIILTLLLLFLTSSLSAQWYRQLFPADEYLWKVRFANENIGWVTSNSHIWKTTNGGATWFAQDTSRGAASALYALDTNTVFCANYDGVNPATAGIRRTTNGGITWQVVDSSGFAFSEFAFGGPQVGFACGYTWVSGSKYIAIIKKTSNAGTAWNTVYLDTTTSYDTFEGISFANQSRGWAVAYNGAVFNTADSGTTWSRQDSSVSYPYPLRDVFFISPDSGWAVGGISGTMVIARTTNGGSSWSATEKGGSSLREVKFLNSRVGWFVGALNVEPYIGHTTNGGETWETQQFIPSNYLGFESFSMVNERVGWAVGGTNRIYKTTNGGVTWVDEVDTAPMRFSLEQNYPNPFNPATVISYELKVKGLVTLTIMDLLGREVAELVNEEKPAGSYSVQWYAANFPSGVYFYRLTAGGFSETKRLSLIK